MRPPGRPGEERHGEGGHRGHTADIGRPPHPGHLVIPVGVGVIVVVSKGEGEGGGGGEGGYRCRCGCGCGCE